MATATVTPAQPRTPEFEDLVIDRGDSILAARVIGGDDLILIHPSLGRGARDFDPLAQRLASGGYRVASFDPRAIGQSTTPQSSQTGLTFNDYAEDMLAVMHALDEPRAHLVGHAFGNRIARTLATIHPEATRTVTLCACGGGTPSPQAEEGIQLAVNPDTPIPQFKTAVKSTFFAPTSDPSPWYVGWYDVGAEEESSATAASQSADYEAGGVAPMLIIQGLDDIVAPPSIGHGLKSQYGAPVELHDLAGCAHALIIEQTDEIATIMLDYLGRQSPARPAVVVAFHSHRSRVPLVTLHTTTGTLTGIVIELAHGRPAVASAHVARLTTTPRMVKLTPSRGRRIAAGRYTLSVRSTGHALFEATVNVA
jgi:pimeloyl-ACP methyl ester carboxylesterase